MSQADYIISDQDGASFLVDINNQLAAIVSNNSGTTEPATTYAYQWWADTTAGLLKQRNAANSAWVTIGKLGEANLGHVNATSQTGSAILPSGTTAERDSSPLFGYMRGNFTTSLLEWWNGTVWSPISAYVGLITGSGLTQNTNKLLGRSTAGVGAIEELSIGSGLSLTGGVLDSAVVQNVTKYLVTDSTDIALALAGTGTQSNVGSSFSAKIPVDGCIKFSGFSGRITNNGTAAVHRTVFGVRINSVNFWFGYGNITPVSGATFNSGSVAGANSDFKGQIFPELPSSFDPQYIMNIDISAFGIPTGVQTLQVIAGYIGNQTTLKGTFTPSRVLMEIIG